MDDPGEVEFVHEGQPRRLSRQRVIDAVQYETPEIIQSWAVEIEGRLFPVKQVWACSTGQPRSTFNAAQVSVFLRQLGFSLVDTRGQRDARHVVRLGPLTLDPSRHTAVLGNVALSLTPTEYRLLYLLVARPNKVLSRQELAEAVWGTHDPSIDLSLAVHVRHLRAKLKRSSVPAPEIVAVRSVGYQLIWESASRNEPHSSAPSQ